MLLPGAFGEREADIMVFAWCDSGISICKTFHIFLSPATLLIKHDALFSLLISYSV